MLMMSHGSKSDFKLGISWNRVVSGSIEQKTQPLQETATCSSSSSEFGSYTSSSRTCCKRADSTCLSFPSSLHSICIAGFNPLQSPSLWITFAVLFLVSFRVLWSPLPHQHLQIRATPSHVARSSMLLFHPANVPETESFSHLLAVCIVV